MIIIIMIHLILLLLFLKEEENVYIYTDIYIMYTISMFEKAVQRQHPGKQEQLGVMVVSGCCILIPDHSLPNK